MQIFLWNQSSYKVSNFYRFIKKTIFLKKLNLHINLILYIKFINNFIDDEKTELKAILLFRWKIFDVIIGNAFCSTKYCCCFLFFFTILPEPDIELTKIVTISTSAKLPSWIPKSFPRVEKKLVRRKWFFFTAVADYA